MTKLTVLMPLYNHAEDLPRAVDSVLMQKCSFPYKLIILDDGSTDDGVAVAEKYREKYPEIIEVVRNECNLGILKTIFRGYALLKSDYWCVLDPDDWYCDENFFDDAVTFLEAHPDFTCFAGNILVKKPDEETLWIRTSETERIDDFSSSKVGEAPNYCTPNTLFRNLFSDTDVQKKLATIDTLPFPQSFRADTFRQELALSKGKRYFKNHAYCVYNYTGEGVFSKLSKASQEFALVTLFYTFAHFFTEEREYYMAQAVKAFTRYCATFGRTSLAERPEWQTLLTYMIANPEETTWLAFTPPLFECLQAA